MNQCINHFRKQQSECSDVSSTATLPHEARFQKQQSTPAGSVSEVEDQEAGSFVGKWGKFPFKMRNEVGMSFYKKQSSLADLTLLQLAHSIQILAIYHKKIRGFNET